MSLDDSDEKLALLQEIREQVWGLGSDIHQGVDGKLDGGLGRIEAAVADYAEQVRLAVHDVRVLAKKSGIEIETP
jgi:hypothetical protein